MKQLLFFLSLSMISLSLSAQPATPELKINAPCPDERGKISQSELLSQKKFMLNKENGRIVSFQLQCIDHQLRSVKYVSNSEKLTEPMIREIANGTPNERFTISHIKVQYEGETTYLNPITFFLKS